MSDTVKIKVGVSTNMIGSRIEDLVDTNYTLEEWNGLDEAERQRMENDFLATHIENSVDSWASVVLPDEG
jgi:hypothetical protein